MQREQETIAEISYPFLQGGGEMGELIRRYNWAASSIGTPDKWPQSLKTTVSIILASRFPMFLWWGEGMIQFYNDAYRPSLGNEGKHPAALGQNAIDCWPEIWDIIYPLIQQVRTTGAPTWSEDQLIPIHRNGKIEDVYWTFGYSAVRGESGIVEGVLVVCTETTEKVLGMQQLAKSRDDLRFTIDASELGSWDLDPVTMKFTANERVKEWFGVPLHEEVPLQLALDVIAEKDRQKVVDAIQEALQYESGGEYDIDYTIINPDTGAERVVKAKGKALFNNERIPYRFNGTLQDITAQLSNLKKAENNESRVRSIVEGAPFPIGVYTGREMRIEIANQTILDIWGKGNDVIGKLYAEILPELENQEIFQQLDGVYTTGVPFHAKNQRVDLMIDGRMQIFYFSYSFTPLYDADGVIYGVMNTGADVTELNLAKHKVEKSRQDLRNIIIQAPAAMCIMRGPEYIVEIANDGMLELWGKSADEVMDKPLFEGLHEVRGQGIEELLHNVYTNGETFRAFEWAVELPRGDKRETVYVNFTYEPLYEGDGNISGIIVVALDVTEQVMSRRVTEESEERYRILIEESTVASAFYIGPDIRIQYANDTMLGYWGKDRSVIGKPIVEAIPELEGQPFPAMLQEVYRTGVALEGTEAKATLMVDGMLQDFYFTFAYRAVRNAQGQIYAINHSAIDVTERVLARKVVEEAEERLRLAVDATSLSHWELDPNQRAIIHSPRLAEIFGHDAATILTHKQMREQLHPDDRQHIVEKAFDTAMQTGVYSYEARIVKPDNTVCWIRTMGKVFFDDNKNPLKLIGTLQDITAEKLSQQQLEEREQKFRLLADSMPQFVWTSDADGNLNYFNHTVYTYSGLSKEQIAEHGWLQIVHPDDHEENIAKWMEAITTGDTFLLEHRFRRHDGEYRWQLSRAIPQRDSNGDIRMWVGTSTDIQYQKNFSAELENQVKERTQELEQKNIELEKTNAELAQFAYIASHDLQEPLRKVSTFAQMLETSLGNIDTRSKNYLDKINTSTARMIALIRDVLSYSQLSQGDVAMKQANLNEILEGIENDFELLIEQKNATIVYNNLPVIEGLPLQLSQLFTNLISNSLKFSKADVDPVIHIDVRVLDKEDVAKHPSLDEGKEYYNIEFRDNGIGFSQEHARKIFNIFQRLHNKTEYSGTGIGLAMCKKIVQNHKGEIFAIATKGEGAMFNVILPKEQ